MQGAFIYFLLICYWVQFLGLFSTLSITFFTPLSARSTALSSPKIMYQTGISSPYPAPWLICFPVTLHLMAQLGRVRKRLKILLKFFGTCPPVCPPIPPIISGFKGYLADFLSPSPKNKTNAHSKKFLIFREMEFPDSQIKIFLIFPEMVPCSFHPKLKK